MKQVDILLVEDDLRLAKLTQDYLENNGFSLIAEDHCAGALQRLKACSPKLILLDLNLPDGDGVDLCRQIRTSFSGPILMLTARDTNLDQVVGLESGADDYITKPVDPMVLLARIRAFLRRTDTATTNTSEDIHVFQLGKLALNFSSQEASFDGVEVKLTSMEFSLLEVLARNAGKIVSRDELNLQARGIEYDGLDRTVDVRISRLRKKFMDDLDEPKRIKTVWGKGYLLVPDQW